MKYNVFYGRVFTQRGLCRLSVSNPPMRFTMKNNSAIFYTCSLIEYIGRSTKQKRSAVASALGKSFIARIYRDSDVLHCEPIEKIADEVIQMKDLQSGVAPARTKPSRFLVCAVCEFSDIAPCAFSDCRTFRFQPEIVFFTVARYKIWRAG